MSNITPMELPEPNTVSTSEVVHRVKAALDETQIDAHRIEDELADMGYAPGLAEDIVQAAMALYAPDEPENAILLDDMGVAR